MATRPSKERNWIRRTVRNRFYDPALADRARDWGDERLLAELGIKVPKRINKVPELKPLTDKARTRGARKLRKFRLGVQVGLTPDEARRVSKYADTRIRQAAIYRDEVDAGLPKKGRSRRYKQWVEWSRANQKYMPPQINARAAEINRQQGLGDNAKFGYLAAYFEYVEDKGLDYVLNNVCKPDPFNEQAVLYANNWIKPS